MAVLTKKVKMSELTGELKEFGIAMGAETIGVAPVERFAPAPVGFHPTDLLPGAKSVVGFTVPQLAGYCENTPNNSYTQYGYIFKNLYIDRIAWEIARFLDNHGYWALPYCREGQTTTQVEGFNPNPFFERNYRDQEKAAAKVKLTMRGDISMRKAVEAAGLGRIGVNGLLLTPEHGPRNRMGVVITTAELEPNPVIKEELCNHCLRCVKECPAGAITENGPSEFNPIKCIMTVQRWGTTYPEAVKRMLSRRQNAWDNVTRLRGDAKFVVYNLIVGTGLCGSKCISPCPVGRRTMK